VRLPRLVTAGFVTSALLIAGLAGCTSDDTGSADAIVIGMDVDNGSPVDQAYVRAAQLRIDQINASGRLGGRKLSLRLQDNRSDPTSTQRTIDTFAADPTVAAVLTGSCDDCVIGAARTINTKGMPTIALSGTDEVTSPVADRRWIFRLGPNPIDSTAAMVAELRRAGVPHVAVLHSDDRYGRGENAALLAELGKAGIRVRADRAIKPTAIDIGPTVSALTATRAAALLVLTGPESASAAATGAKAASYHGRIFFDPAAASDLFLPTGAAAATNNTTMVFTQIMAIDDVIATTPAKASRKQWFRDYTSRYGTYSGVAAFAADGVDLIAAAVERAGGDRVRIRDIIETSQVDGLAGPIRLTPDNHSGLMPQALTLLVARSGRWRLAS
jgi:branched-chain amino acid transport system substrate-binding protein